MSSISIFAMDHICTGMAGLGYLLEHPNFVLHLARRELQERGWKRRRVITLDLEFTSIEGG